MKRWRVGLRSSRGIHIRRRRAIGHGIWLRTGEGQDRQPLPPGVRGFLFVYGTIALFLPSEPLGRQIRGTPRLLGLRLRSQIFGTVSTLFDQKQQIKERRRVHRLHDGGGAAPQNRCRVLASPALPVRAALVPRARLHAPANTWRPQ